jgi:hypothetical protein
MRAPREGLGGTVSAVRRTECFCRGSHDRQSWIVDAPSRSRTGSRSPSIASRKTKRGIGTIAIMPNDTVTYREDSFDNMKAFAAKHSFSFPYVSMRRRR